MGHTSYAGKRDRVGLHGMANVINLNQYREERERRARKAREKSYWAWRGDDRPVRSVDELEDIRREVERMRRERPSRDDGPEAG